MGLGFRVWDSGFRVKGMPCYVSSFLLDPAMYLLFAAGHFHLWLGSYVNRQSNLRKHAAAFYRVQPLGSADLFSEAAEDDDGEAR